MANSRNRWELEEKRKKQREQAVNAILQDIKSGGSYKGNAVQQTVSQPVNKQAAQSTRNRAGSKSSQKASTPARSTGSSSSSAARTNTTTTTPASQQQSSFGLQGLQNLPIFGVGNVSSAGSSLHRVGSTTREDYLAGGAVRRRTNIDSRTGTNTSRGTQREEDEKNLQLNMARWHMTDDQAERDRLHQANNAIRARLGLAYDNGTTYDPRTGRNYSLATDLLFSGTAAQRARMASQYPLSREAHGLDWDTPSIYPSMQQIVEAGSAEAARGTSAREALQDLYTRSEETWTEQDTKTRDRAVEALEDEMSEILSRYGLHYRRGLLDMGGWSDETATDATATDLLRRAGANEQTIRYVENNIEQRQAADRLGQGVEAVVKRAVGSIPALFETAQQQSENVEQSRQNPEYVQLEAEEQQLENQLTGMPSTNYDGTLNQEYMDVYNRLQQVRERKGQLAVQTPVDQSKWGQTMLREAGEAQANATAGLSRVPRLLANTGISIAGNAPGMAASLIPGFGPAIGAGLMATQAAGQRAQELSARGVSPSEALGRGVVSGLIEAVTEKLPIDHLSNILHSGGIVAVRNFLRQMGIEATEESASYVMNFAADWAANDPDAQFSFAELVDQALGGALSGGFYATVGTVGGKALAGPQAAQTNVQQGQAGQRPFWQAEPVTGDFAANETGPANTEPVRAGRVTTIQSPYTGKTPVNTSPQTQGQALTIGADALDSARQAITASQQSGTFARTIKSVLQSVFQQQGGPRSVTVQGVTFDGQPYEVTLGNKTAAKIASDPNMSAEKLAAFNDLDSAISTAEYVGSGHYNKRKSKSEKVIRYDYFEKPLKINGQDYVMSFDVEVYPGTNNFRTYKVINQIDLMPVTAIRRSTTDGHITMQSGLSDNSISQTDGNINPAEGNSQAFGRRLAELDEELRAAEGMLPGPARDARIDEIRTKIRIASAPADRQTTMHDFQARRQAQAARDFAAIGEPIEEAVQAAPAAQTPETIQTQAAPAAQTPETIQTQAEQLALEQEPQPAASVPVTEAIQYGKTPEQAMQEAAVRAQGEARQAERNARIAADIERTSGGRADNPYYGLTRQQMQNERDFAKQLIARAKADGRPKRAAELESRLVQIEEAIADAEENRFKRGDRVFALDRNNFGEIARDLDNGYYEVYFVNAQTGENGIHTLHGDLLQSIMPEERTTQLDPQEAGELTGDIADYSAEEFERIAQEGPDQYAALPKRDLSSFKSEGAWKALRSDDEMQQDIQAAIEDADQQGKSRIVPAEIALNIGEPHNPYNKTLERILDDVSKGNPQMREWFRKNFEMPFDFAKGNYARGVATQFDEYFDAMKKSKIKLGSKESAAVMWYGEGQRMQQTGDVEPYTLADLKRDFPKNWRSIVEADKVNRQIYDAYIPKIQQARREIYPYAEQRVELAISRRRANIAALSEKIRNLDAKIESNTATEGDRASRDILMRELQRLEKDLKQKVADRDSGKAFANQRLFPRKDYYHHMLEISEGFSALKNILDIDNNIDPRLVGKSDNTKPNAKWSGILQKRKGVKALEDSVAAMLEYIPQAEYMINIDPQIARMRTMVRDIVDTTSEAGQTNANRFIEWLTDYANDLAGKTNIVDRAFQRIITRRGMKILRWINNRAKSNAILGNLNSALAQVYNLPNGIAIINNPIDLARGMTDYVSSRLPNSSAKHLLDSSDFLKERFLDSHRKQFEESLLKKPEKFAEWLLTVGDQQVSEYIWLSAYEQGLRKGVNNANNYADDLTRRAIAGRGVGEMPIMQRSQFVQFVAPFQVEVANSYYLMKDLVGKKAAIALTVLFLSTFLLNEVKEPLTGSRTGMDIIDAARDAIKEVTDPEFDGNWLDKGFRVGTRLGGEVMSNMPFGSQIASLIVSDDSRRSELFGESDPTRFGTGNIGLDAFFEPITQFINGETVNPWDPVTNYVLPWGGRQISRGVDMAEQLGLLPVFRVSTDGVQADRQPAQGSYTDDGTRLRFPTDTDWGNLLRGFAFGPYATDSGRAYIENGMRMLSEDQTAAFTQGVADMGLDEHTLYDAILQISRAEPVKNAEGETEISGKQVARRMLFERDDMTPAQKAWLDGQLLIDPDSDETPPDYSDYNTFMLGQYVSESRQDAAREAISHGLDIDQFVSWDDRLRELQNEKDANDERVRTDAAGLEMALDEVMQDSALSNSEKQAIADYVLISSMSDKQREDWETGGRGNVNASDFVRWTSRVSQLENEKGADDKQVRTAAEARNMVLDELAAAAIDDETRQKIAEYVIIPTMGEADEKTREGWANIAKGHVNATDFVRFKDDTAIYGEWAEGSGTDNARNVAEILRGYDGISDEQRDILFQTYTETMASNPFHVSSYEQQIEGNQFYQDLSEDGRLALRALTNEYEQYLNEGRELEDWLAKAYMAEREAGIAPGTYALFRVALEAINEQVDGNTNRSQEEVEAAVNSIPGLTLYQKAYIWQSQNRDWKKNPFGSATVGEYSSGMEVGINPIAGGVVTSFFGPRKSFQTDNGAWASSLHPSIDIGAAEGTPIGAYKSGTVIQNGWVSGYGWTIEVEHGDGTVSAYHHMMQQSPVAVGTAVSQGQQIGQVGQTGNSKGPHLDLTITRDGTPIDPATLIPELEGSASGYIYEGTVSSGAVSSGAATARAAKASSGGSSGSSGLKKLEGLSGLKSLF